MNIEEARKMMAQWLFTEKIVPVKKDGTKGEPISFHGDSGKKIGIHLVESYKEPYVFVSSEGELFFSDAVKKYTSEADVTDALHLLIGFGELTPPLLILLTRSLRELATIDPNKKVVHLKAEIELTEEQTKRVIQRIKEKETKEYVM